MSARLNENIDIRAVRLVVVNDLETVELTGRQWRGGGWFRGGETEASNESDKDGLEMSTPGEPQTWKGFEGIWESLGWGGIVVWWEEMKATC